MGARSPKSQAMIKSALSSTHRALQATASLEAWAGPYYQLANRLAWTHWLRQHDVEALFAHVLFADDLSHMPTSADELTGAAKAAHRALGVRSEAIAPWAATVMLPAAR